MTSREDMLLLVQTRLSSGELGGQILFDLLQASIGESSSSDSLRSRAMSSEAVVNSYYALLNRPSRLTSKDRKRLKRFNSLEHVVDCIGKSSKVVCVVGAGASTSAGLPDFRSAGGIYDMVRESGEKLEDPRLLFDEAQFKLDPGPFFRVAAKLLTTEGEVRPTKCHDFINMLEKRGKLLRCYTQNLDGLECRAGATKIVYCHGNLATSTCTVCGVKCATTLDGRVPYCATGDGGVIKPDIVFFGQALPVEYRSNVEKDTKEADIVLVFGSSLKVNPVATLVTMFPLRTPFVLVNREVVGKPHEFDVEMLGNCDAVANELAKQLGWKDESSLEVWPEITFVEPNTHMFDATPADLATMRKEKEKRKREEANEDARKKPNIAVVDDCAPTALSLKSKPFAPNETKAMEKFIRESLADPAMTVTWELGKDKIPKALKDRRPDELVALYQLLISRCFQIIPNASPPSKGNASTSENTAGGNNAELKGSYDSHGLDSVWARQFINSCKRFL